MLECVFSYIPVKRQAHIHCPVRTGIHASILRSNWGHVFPEPRREGGSRTTRTRAPVRSEEEGATCLGVVSDLELWNIGILESACWSGLKFFDQHQRDRHQFCAWMRKSKLYHCWLAASRIRSCSWQNIFWKLAQVVNIQWPPGGEELTGRERPRGWVACFEEKTAISPKFPLRKIDELASVLRGGV